MLTSLLVVWIGIALLMGAPLIGLFGHFGARNNVLPAKLEIQPAQINP